MKNLVGVVCDVYIDDSGDVSAHIIDEDNVLDIALILGDQNNDNIKHPGWDWAEIKSRVK